MVGRVDVRVVSVPGLTGDSFTSLHLSRAHRTSVTGSVSSGALDIPHTAGNSTGGGLVVYLTVRSYLQSFSVPAHSLTLSSFRVRVLITCVVNSVILRLFVTENVRHHRF